MIRSTTLALIAILIGLGAGWGMPSAASSTRFPAGATGTTGVPDQSVPSRAQFDAWASALGDDQVLVTPGSDLSDRQVDEVQEAVRTGTRPTYVLIADGSAWTATPEEVAAELGARIEDDRPLRSVLVYAGQQTLPSMGVSSRPENLDPRSAAVFVDDLTDRSASRRFVRLVELATTGKGDAALDGAMAEMWDAEPPPREDSAVAEEEEPDPGWSRWVAVVVLGAVVGVFVMLRGRAVLGWWNRRRRATRLESYSADARDVRDRATAQRRLLGLGEAIDAAEMRPHDDARHWQSALDHYGLAGRVADQRRDQTDDVGVIVLCDLGQRHLAAAHGAEFDSTPRCYLDPLHGPAVGHTRVVQTKVPVCERCLSAKPDRRRPFLVDGKPWYRTGRDPWVGSGYGALVDLAVVVPRWLAKRA